MESLGCVQSIEIFIGRDCCRTDNVSEFSQVYLLQYEYYVAMLLLDNNIWNSRIRRCIGIVLFFVFSLWKARSQEVATMTF